VRHFVQMVGVGRCGGIEKTSLISLTSEDRRARPHVPFWAKDVKVGFANINAKAEGIEGKPAFREAFQRRRCLVPVDNFYEWKKTVTGKQPQ
jgi:putative SOS response-associated peptidase YedK